jgi:4-oxalocrotonate tautomerase
MPIFSSQLELKRGETMPLLNVKLIDGVFTTAQKREMIRKLTDAMVSIEGEYMREVTMVVIDEVKSGDWGIGGDFLTTEDAMAIAAVSHPFSGPSANNSCHGPVG